MDIQIIAIIIDLIIALSVTQAIWTRQKLAADRSLALLAVFAALWSTCDVLIRRPV